MYFSLKVLRLTVNAGTGGAVALSWSEGGSNAIPSSPHINNFEFGKQVTLSATAYSGYNFVNWSDGSTDASRTITISQDTPSTLTANFGLATYTFTLNAGTGGLVNQGARPLNNGQYSDADLTTGASASSSVSYPYNTYIDFEAQPNTGYFFNGWTPSNYSAPLLTGDSSDARRRTTVVEDVTLTAKFCSSDDIYKCFCFNWRVC